MITQYTSFCENIGQLKNLKTLKTRLKGNPQTRHLLFQTGPTVVFPDIHILQSLKD